MSNVRAIVSSLILAFGALSLSALPASAVSISSGVPIKVNACEPRQNQSTHVVGYSGYMPGYYPHGGRYMYPNVYGRSYYQIPMRTSTTTNPTLSINYVNVSAKPMKTVEFGLVANGGVVAEVRDVGTFTPGAEIKHEFGLNPNVFPLRTSLTRCVPLRVTYEDGTMWKNPHLPSDKERYGP